jgi:hypothetical protein
MSVVCARRDQAGVHNGSVDASRPIRTIKGRLVQRDTPGIVAWLGPRRTWAGAQPPTGVPDPIAIAKMCRAVIPLPTPALTVGSVTDATVLPACSGTDAK